MAGSLGAWLGEFQITRGGCGLVDWEEVEPSDWWSGRRWSLLIAGGGTGALVN